MREEAPEPSNTEESSRGYIAVTPSPLRTFASQFKPVHVRSRAPLPAFSCTPLHPLALLCSLLHALDIPNSRLWIWGSPVQVGVAVPFSPATRNRQACTRGAFA